MSYTASKAQSSQGTVLALSLVASPPTWVNIGEVLSFTFNNKNMFDDTTNLQSTAKEFLAILPDPGVASVDLNRVSTDGGQADLLASFNATPPTRLTYQLTFPINTAAGQSTLGDTATFLAYVEQLSPDVKVDKKIQAKFSLRITGAITWVEGS